MSATFASVLDRRTLSIGRSRVVVEMKNMWRSPQRFGFTILFPVMMLLLFASIFGGTVDGTAVKMSQVYVLSLIHI